MYSTEKSDFGHHSKEVARLNNGSFGSPPACVLKAQDEIRRSWLQQPDEWYFTGKLHREQRKAARSAIPHITRADPDTIEDDQICLVENATVASVAIARRWSRVIQPGDVILVLSVVYKALINTLKEYCEAVGAKIEFIDVPFPCDSSLSIVLGVKEQLQKLPKKPRFAFVDHVSSQPAILLPVKDIIKVIRQYGTDDMEIAVDGAHSIGSTTFDVKELGCDWFLSNLHKWGFAVAPTTLIYAASSSLMKSTTHPITSWAWGQGLASESLFPGTRDFSAILSVPVAMEFLSSWRSTLGETSVEYCHRRVIESAHLLARAWNTETLTPLDPDLIATQAMVRLPVNLRVDDVPGVPGVGIRALLRSKYKVEAAIGNFGPDIGAFIRLSFAIYNTNEDIERLRDGILDILNEQQK